jgi:hypothetical protein
MKYFNLEISMTQQLAQFQATPILSHMTITLIRLNNDLNVLLRPSFAIFYISFLSPVSPHGPFH